MNTPICDFVRSYGEENPLRLHMPGHKGAKLLGMESLDITEIEGADSLYEADGIIRESEKNASALFGCDTFYSTEGSSLCIRAMVYLSAVYARSCGRKPLIAAGRNAHKTFLSAAALCGVDIKWLRPEAESAYLSCCISAKELEKQLCAAAEMPTAVYITSPDYLGKTADVAALSRVCRERGVLLLVDCAHGAYTAFLPESEHPIALGADLCCTSAHKTLPVLTGGAYLHMSPALPEYFTRQAKNALALFGSTSPSYLILQSLDAVNPYLAGHKERLAAFLPIVDGLKQRICRQGYTLYGEEKMKLTLCAKEYGYRGSELQKLMRDKGIYCEFADADYLVMMFSPELGEAAIMRIEEALCSIERKAPIKDPPPILPEGEAVLSIREAVMAPSETVCVDNAEGRILAAASVSCPPAVPILVCGERIDAAAIECFKYYGIEKCSVVI